MVFIKENQIAGTSSDLYARDAELPFQLQSKIQHITISKRRINYQLLSMFASSVSGRRAALIVDNSYCFLPCFSLISHQHYCGPVYYYFLQAVKW
ncbi:MAG: hypothetical protein GY730_02630 [bacterium]|nr:hypothetical protein [bacterium]